MITFVSGIDAVKANELEFLLLFGDGTFEEGLSGEGEGSKWVKGRKGSFLANFELFQQ